MPRVRWRPCSFPTTCSTAAPRRNCCRAAKRSGVAALAYSPLASGILTEAFEARRRRRLPGDDWRSRAAAFNEPLLSRHLRAAAALRALAAERGVRAEQLAIAWAAGHRAVRGVIVGTRTPQQVEHAAEATNVRLDAKARIGLASAVEAELNQSAGRHGTNP